MAIAAALLVGVAVVRNAMVEQFAEVRPAAAAKVWASHPASELWLGLTEIGLSARQRTPVAPATLARIQDAAIKSPLAPEPYLVRGVQAQLAGDSQLARGAFVAAKLRDGRSIPARYFLAELYFRRGEARQGLREISILAKMVPNGVANLAPFIATYAKDPRTRPQLEALFRTDPVLKDAALTTLASDAANADLILDLNGRSANTPEWTGGLVRALVAAGQYGKARAVWARLAHVSPAPDQLIFDPQFRDNDTPPPFNWTLASSTLGLAERQGRDRLHVVYYGQEDGILASQLLVLQPGRYRLAMHVAGDTANASALVWTLTCNPSGTVPLSLPLSQSARWGHGVEFVVPAGCAAQRLELTGHAPEIPHQADVIVSGLRLTRQEQR